MKQKKLFIAILFMIFSLCVNLQGIYAQDNPNTITFDNFSLLNEGNGHKITTFDRDNPWKFISDFNLSSGELTIFSDRYGVSNVSQEEVGERFNLTEIIKFKLEPEVVLAKLNAIAASEFAEMALSYLEGLSLEEYETFYTRENVYDIDQRGNRIKTSRRKILEALGYNKYSQETIVGLKAILKSPVEGPAGRERQEQAAFALAIFLQDFIIPGQGTLPQENEAGYGYGANCAGSSCVAYNFFVGPKGEEDKDMQKIVGIAQTTGHMLITLNLGDGHLWGLELADNTKPLMNIIDKYYPGSKVYGGKEAKAVLNQAIKNNLAIQLENAGKPELAQRYFDKKKEIGYEYYGRYPLLWQARYNDEGKRGLYAIVEDLGQGIMQTMDVVTQGKHFILTPKGIEDGTVQQVARLAGTNYIFVKFSKQEKGEVISEQAILSKGKLELLNTNNRDLWIQAYKQAAGVKIPDVD